jgi:hypothetical protein
VSFRTFHPEDRLCTRADKIENLAARDLVFDLLAARALRALLRAFNKADVITL